MKSTNKALADAVQSSLGSLNRFGSYDVSKEDVSIRYDDNAEAPKESPVSIKKISESETVESDRNSETKNKRKVKSRRGKIICYGFIILALLLVGLAVGIYFGQYHFNTPYSEPVNMNANTTQQVMIRLPSTSGEDANITSSTISPRTTKKDLLEENCIKRQLPFCRSVLSYEETVSTDWLGHTTASERNDSIQYYQIIADSGCHPQFKPFVCTLLEPPCTVSGNVLPPCRRFCQNVAKDCSDHVIMALNLYGVLKDCEQFPESINQEDCSYPNLMSECQDSECVESENHDYTF